MITRFNNVKMAADSSKAEYYLIKPDVSKPEKEFNIPKNMGTVTVLMVGNKDHEDE